MRTTALLLPLLLALPACLHVDYTDGAPVAFERAAEIRPGATTKSEVLALLGAPQNFSNPTTLGDFLEARGLERGAWSQFPFTDIFVYQLTKGRLVGWTVIFYTDIEFEVDSDLLLVFFDERGVVRHIGTKRIPPEDEDDAGGDGDA
ncbi:MAG: hypothetical protein MUE73_01370 [Planctomycetes bacterium]|jgi:hypothetical protein|nr:hypothetical protein [Planctomycetota bacterium]